jgi:hypothetical protein
LVIVSSGAIFLSRGIFEGTGVFVEVRQPDVV